MHFGISSFLRAASVVQCTRSAWHLISWAFKPRRFISLLKLTWSMISVQNCIVRILYACPIQYVFYLLIENCEAYEDAIINRMSYYLGHIDGIITVQTVMNLLNFGVFCCPQSSWSKVGVGDISLSERIMLASKANSMLAVTWTIQFMSFMWYDTLDRHLGPAQLLSNVRHFDCCCPWWAGLYQLIFNLYTSG